MNENKTIKTALLSLLCGLLVFWLITPKHITKIYTSDDDDNMGGIKRRYIPDPTFNTQELEFNSKAGNAILALKSYIHAWNEGVGENELIELNKELMNTFGLKVKNRDTELVVVDANNKTVIVNKIA
jgi:hypothetical protein